MSIKEYYDRIKSEQNKLSNEVQANPEGGLRQGTTSKLPWYFIESAVTNGFANRESLDLVRNGVPTEELGMDDLSLPEIYSSTKKYFEGQGITDEADLDNAIKTWWEENSPFDKK